MLSKIMGGVGNVSVTGTSLWKFFGWRYEAVGEEMKQMAEGKGFCLLALMSVSPP
jgi:hypothetical protein